MSSVPLVRLRRCFNPLGALSLVAILSCAALAQTPDAAAPNSTLQQHPADALKNLEPTGHEEYEVGGGDELTVSVAGRPELSGPQLVGPDGRITLPVVGSVDIGGLTRDAAAAAITKAVSNFYTEVSVTVQVSKYGSNHILLVGNVEHPGILNFDQPPTLLEAITRGGMIPAGGEGKSPARFPTRCIIYRGENQVVSVDLEDLLSGGKAFTDIHLRRNDVLFIPADQDKIVSVIGEVRSPGAISFTHNTTLIKLIAETGGLTAGAGPTLQIVHPSTNTTQYVAFKDLLKPNGGTDISLLNGDIVYIPKSGLAKMGYVLQQIAPAAGIATIATFAVR